MGTGSAGKALESCLLQMLNVSRVSERRSRGPQGSNASLLLMDRREGSSRGASARAKGSEQQKTASTSGWGSCSGWLRAVVWQKGQLLGLGLDTLVSAASEDAPALALVNAAPLDLPGSLLIEGVCRFWPCATSAPAPHIRTRAATGGRHLLIPLSSGPSETLAFGAREPPAGCQLLSQPGRARSKCFFFFFSASSCKHGASGGAVAGWASSGGICVMQPYLYMEMIFSCRDAVCIYGSC